jgi:hypothetical protein
MEQHRRILEIASRDSLPESLSEASELPIHVVRELIEAGYLTAADASSFDGIEYLNPRITLSGREYLRTLSTPNRGDSDDLIARLQKVRDIMVSVSTGKRSIDEINGEYRELFAETDAALRKLAIANPNPFTDLWDWYGRWRSGDLPSYNSRREFLASIFNPLLQQIRARQFGQVMAISDPTGWPKVDRQVGETRRRLAEAETEEQFQATGLVCREVLISLAQAVHDPARHPPLDGTEPSQTDAKRMLETYIAVEFEGSSNEALRRHAKAAYTLAIDLQHRRTASFRDAALCVEATTSVVSVIAIISGRRDPVH